MGCCRSRPLAATIPAVDDADPVGPVPFEPNFGFMYEVTLKQTSPERVMQVLFASDRVKEVVGLSSLCVAFELLSTADSKAEAASSPAPALPALGGCRFTFTERVPVFCGLTQDVVLRVRQRYSLETGELLYESVSNSNIHVRKRRVVKAGEGAGQVVVKEWVEGQASACIAGCAQTKGTEAHRQHMAGYAKLLR
jgi:hypothetical protein